MLYIVYIHACRATDTENEECTIKKANTFTVYMEDMDIINNEGR